ncbi:21287_t:CDS:1, partial [Cetraspora pellucida]
KMRVDLAEHILSQKVKKAIAEIPELKNISQGLRLYIKFLYKSKLKIQHIKFCNFD